MKKHRKNFNNRNRNNKNIKKNTKEVKSVITTVNKKTSEEDKTIDNQNENKSKSIVTKINFLNKNERVEKNEKEDKTQIRDRVIIDSRNLKTNQNKKIFVKRNRSIIPYKINTFSSEVCPLCNKIITNMSTSIPYKDSDKNCHFECVSEEIKKRVNLKQNQRLTYVGSGIFAVIEDEKKVDGKFKFVIKQRINYSK